MTDGWSPEQLSPDASELSEEISLQVFLKSWRMLGGLRKSITTDLVRAPQGAAVAPADKPSPSW
jgi:hypothetical protein